MKFHHYHHLGAETQEFLHDLLSPVKDRLRQIKELLITMGQNQEDLGKTLAEIQEEQKASAARWEVRNAAQQQTIEGLKTLVNQLTVKNDESDAELSDELELAKQILETEQNTFADAQAQSSTETSAENSTTESSETDTETSEEASAESAEPATETTP